MGDDFTGGSMDNDDKKEKYRYHGNLRHGAYGYPEIDEVEAVIVVVDKDKVTEEDQDLWATSIGKGMLIKKGMDLYNDHIINMVNQIAFAFGPGIKLNDRQVKLFQECLHYALAMAYGAIGKNPLEEFGDTKTDAIDLSSLGYIHVGSTRKDH